MTAVDMFTVFPLDDPKDASVCFGTKDAQQTYDAFARNGRVICVLRTTLDHICRDVTEDFEAEPVVEFPAASRWSVGDWQFAARHNR